MLLFFKFNLCNAMKICFLIRFLIYFFKKFFNASTIFLQNILVSRISVIFFHFYTESRMTVKFFSHDC